MFSEGVPSRLADIFRVKNAVFAGKSIAGDVQKVARMAGLSMEEVGDILVVDTARVFYFADALARDAEAVRVWSEGGQSDFLGETGLKDFCEFVEPSRILDKSPHHCYRANFDEAFGAIRWSDLEYSSLDVKRTMEAVNDFAGQVGIPAKCDDHQGTRYTK